MTRILEYLSYHAILFIFFCTMSISYSNTFKTAILSTSHSSLRTTNDSHAFDELFQKNNAITSILSVNPGLISVIKISDTIYRGELSPIHSPGLSIFQTIDFHVERPKKNVFIFSVPGDSVKQTYKGLPFLVKVSAHYIVGWLINLLTIPYYDIYFINMCTPIQVTNTYYFCVLII